MQIGEEVLAIRNLHRQRKSIRAIGRDFRVSREVVRKYLHDPEQEAG